MRLNYFQLSAVADPINAGRLLTGNHFKPFFLLLATCCLLSGGLFAQTTWNGLVNNDWNTAGNWSAGVPDPTDDVIIPNTGNKPVIGALTAAVAKSVKITVAAAQLTINSTASLSINGSTGFALENFGTLDNSGAIQIGNVSSVANRGIVHRNGGTLNNKPGGLIQIDRTSAAEAFYTTGIVNNEGNIQIGGNAAVVGHGIRIEGNTFNNKPGGSISIDRTSVHGIDLAATTTPAPVLNNESLIQIGSQADVGGFGIVNRNGCTFKNQTGGDIRMNRVAACIYNNGTFTNDALITIDNETRKAQDGIYNAVSGNFTNNATGIISIKKPWGNGIWNDSGNFINAGKITIRDILNIFSGTYSTGILNYGTFSSIAGAEIYLDEVGGGIISIRAFTNAGIIRMGENAPLAAMGILNLQANGVFNNNAGGDISIKYTTKDAIQNDAPSSFFNNACAQLTIFGSVNNTGTFTNSGLFRVNGTAKAHTNTALTNNGVIEYVQGAITIPNVTNNDVVVTSMTGECTVPNILALGGMNSFTVGTTWYTDPALTIPAGTYNQAANSFSYNQSPVEGTYTLYFAVSDGANGCTRTLSIRLTYDDVTRPTITCPPTQIIGTTLGQCTGIATFSTPTGADNCALANPPVTRIGGLASGSPFPKGITIVTFQATDATGLTKTCTFRITVNDTELPTVTCPSSQSLSVAAGTCASASYTYTITAADNCSSPAPALTRLNGPASGSNFPKGVSNVTWRAMDAAGNTKTCSFSVTVTDNVLPGIACPGNMAVTAAAGECSAVATYANPTATDNCAVASVILQNGLASGSVFPQGVTTNTWQAVDDSGLSATCTFTVTVSCGANPSQPARWGGKETSLTLSRSSAPSPRLSLSLAPNPATMEVQISVEGSGISNDQVSGGELTVLDAQGKLVWRQDLGNSTTQQPYNPTTQQLSVANFPAGLYFVTLRAAGEVVTKRLVVSRL